MPILYIHGVSVRDEAGWDQVETLLRRYVAPELSSDPESVEIKYCFWGEHAAKLSWLGGSIPETPAKMALQASASRLKQSRDRVVDFKNKFKTGKFLKEGRLLSRSRLSRRSKDERLASEFTPRLRRLRSLSKEMLSNFCTATIMRTDHHSPEERALLVVAADEVIHSDEAMNELVKCESLEQEAAVLEKWVINKFDALKHGLVHRRQYKSTRLSSEASREMGVHLKEGLTRSVFSPSFAITRVAMEMKHPLAQFVTRFLGDVFTYLHRRGDATSPGPIPLCVLNALMECREIQKSKDEPIVVLTHSMGGQIMYDVVSHFLPSMPELEDVRVDFWCASASQVGFFEELKLFLNSSQDFGSDRAVSKMVPHPDRKHLGYWWNVWDHNDFVSYSVKSVVEEVDDEAYNTGMDIIGAHVGYLVLPSFYRRFGAKVAQAREKNFFRPAKLLNRS